MAKTSFTFSSKTLRAVAVALGVVGLANAWFALRLPMVTLDTTLLDFTQLDAQVAAYPHKSKVRVLLLGNSHAVAALRVPAVAKALGLAPDACFSFAAAFLTAHEQQELVRRYLSQFPRAETAILMIDPFMWFSHHDPRLRYLTRHDWSARWEDAIETPQLEKRTQMLLGWWLPLLDYASLLRTSGKRDPRRMAARLVQDEPLPDAARLASYPWGLPPTWEGMTPAQLATLRAHGQEAGAIQTKMAFMMGRAEWAPANQKAFRETLRLLDARGVASHLVEAPLETRMHTLMRRPPYRDRFLTYQAALADRPVLHPAPEGWDRHWYHDQDHLTPEGAARLAQALAAAIRVN